MQESVKHFLLQRDKQMAQLGGGEERSAAVFSSAADALVPKKGIFNSIFWP